MTISNQELDVLLNVARLYLKCLDEDPENEYLNVVEAVRVTEIRDIVAKYD